MSDSDRDEMQDAQIAACLRKTVAEHFKVNREEITLRLIRTEVEAELGLEKDFLKSDSHWKKESKDIILQEVEIQEANNAADVPSSPKKPSPKKKKKVERKPAPKKAKAKPPQSDDEAEKPPSPKAQKKTSPKKSKPTPAAKPESSNLSELDESPPRKRGRTATARSRPSKRAKIESDEDEEESAAQEATETPPEPATEPTADSGDESEMSVLIDSPPPNKRNRRLKGAAAEPKKKKAKAPVKPRKEKAPAKDVSPDEEKMKTLQGQLLKCGIRKIWSRELAKYDTPKEKIQHLKKLLVEVGMTGQFSIAKAKKIKDERELQAEVAAIQQGAGYTSDDDGKAGTRSRGPAAGTAVPPRRRLARGLDSLDFLGDQSEDSD